MSFDILIDEISLKRADSQDAIKEKSNHISVYPNPTENYIQLQGIQDNNIVKIYNIFGEEIAAYQKLRSNYKINISSLATGAYFIQINNKLCGKFIKK